MANKPMKPAGGGDGAMNMKSHRAPTTTGRNRPTMGTSAYHLVDDASANDVRGGFLEARPEGIGSDVMAFGRSKPRSQVEVGGPQFGITASRGAQAETYSGTLAEGRLMRPATRTPGSEFSSSATTYGVTGPGSGSSGGGGRRASSKPKGAWKPPRSGKRS